MGLYPGAEGEGFEDWRDECIANRRDGENFHYFTLLFHEKLTEGAVMREAGIPEFH